MNVQVICASMGNVKGMITWSVSAVPRGTGETYARGHVQIVKVVSCNIIFQCEIVSKK